MQNQVLEKVTNRNAEGENMLLRSDWSAKKRFYFTASFLSFALVN